MNSDSLNIVSRLGEGHLPCTFFLSEPQLKTTVCSGFETESLFSFVFSLLFLFFPKLCICRQCLLLGGLGGSGDSEGSQKSSRSQ